MSDELKRLKNVSSQSEIIENPLLYRAHLVVRKGAFRI